MPNNGSLPNMQMANWIRNFVSNHPQRPAPKPDPDYKLANEYNYKFNVLLDKSLKSTEDNLILEGTFDIVQNYTDNINLYYLNNFGFTTKLTDFTFDFNTDVLEINLDKSFYNYEHINFVFKINQTYNNVKINTAFTCFYNKTYIPIYIDDN
jgi:hypothetical protein